MSGNQALSGIKQQREELDDVKDTVKNEKYKYWHKVEKSEALTLLLFQLSSVRGQ